MTKKIFVIVFGVACVITALGIGRAAWRTHKAVQQLRELRLLVADALKEKNRWQREKWAPEDFFSDPKMQQVCRAISSKDIEVVRKAIARVDDLNQPGKRGVTLLFWSYFDDNLDAFELLLREGADPDARLNAFIPRDGQQPFAGGDSILFMSLRERSFDFFYAALAYTKDVNQLDIWDQSLLIVATSHELATSIDQGFLDRLLEKGIELERTDQFGGTAAYRAALMWRPKISLHLIQAGANPSVRTNSGDSIARVVTYHIESAERRGDGEHMTDARELLAWLGAQESR